MFENNNNGHFSARQTDIDNAILSLCITPETGDIVKFATTPGGSISYERTLTREGVYILFEEIDRRFTLQEFEEYILHKRDCIIGIIPGAELRELDGQLFEEILQICSKTK